MKRLLQAFLAYNPKTLVHEDPRPQSRHSPAFWSRRNKNSFIIECRMTRRIVPLVDGWRYPCHCTSEEYTELFLCTVCGPNVQYSEYYWFTTWPIYFWNKMHVNMHRYIYKTVSALCSITSAHRCRRCAQERAARMPPDTGRHCCHKSEHQI